jgi:hypothetical protein
MKKAEKAIHGEVEIKRAMVGKGDVDGTTE